MKRKRIIFITVIVLLLITLSIYTIIFLKNKSNDIPNSTAKNITMEDREHSSIVYDIDGNPIDDLSNSV